MKECIFYAFFSAFFLFFLIKLLFLYFYILGNCFFLLCIFVILTSSLVAPCWPFFCGGLLTCTGSWDSSDFGVGYCLSIAIACYWDGHMAILPQQDGGTKNLLMIFQYRYSSTRVPVWPYMSCVLQ